MASTDERVKALEDRLAALENIVVAAQQAIARAAASPAGRKIAAMLGVKL